MAVSGGGARTQLRAVPSGKAECFDSAGGIPCSDETAPITWQISSRTTPCRKAARGSPTSTTSAVKNCGRNVSSMATKRTIMRSSSMAVEYDDALELRAFAKV